LLAGKRWPAECPFFVGRVMSKPVSAIIMERARELIAEPEHWCRGSYARGKGGVSVSVGDSSARRYCAMGALILAAFDLVGNMGQARELAYSAAGTISNTGSLVFVNDHAGHAAVLALFDKAIADF
jgi:hypothetical protein